MNISKIIGYVSLNISFVVYMIVYLPQIIHNRKVQNIANLSVWLHLSLYSCYFLDLLYGFASNFPWQYKTISFIGVILISIQHMQFLKFSKKNQLVFLYKCGVMLFIVSFAGIFYFFIMQIGNNLDTNSILFLGIVSQGCGLVYSIPQIIKNKSTKSANAVSLYFVYLNLLLAILDTTSSWCLNWGWPIKCIAPIDILFMLIILSQYKKYVTPAFDKVKPVGRLSPN